MLTQTCSSYPHTHVPHKAPAHIPAVPIARAEPSVPGVARTCLWQNRMADQVGYGKGHLTKGLWTVCLISPTESLRRQSCCPTCRADRGSACGSSSEQRLELRLWT